ncbi:hypothetical protein C1645_760992 [Glomus cerebriforme]|uniref:Uncharacterized protein n=1 Tax=Glomus cerebriforme TaxID=658196 RepID=A0A397TGP3_9GLOM|nr:hypothetical protein C1645_760992 [Glomus cerebriforme]
MSSDTTIVSRKSLFSEQEDFSDENFIDGLRMKLFERLSSEVVYMDDDSKEIGKGSHELENDDNEQIFRLFARGPPTKISLESKEIRDYNELVEQMLRSKADNDELRDKKDDPDHMKRINLVTVTFKQIIQESKIPWERHLIPHKVLYVPYKEAEQKIKPKRRKSKKRRDAEKKGLVKKQNHGGSCPGWPTGDKGYAYGWRPSIIEQCSKILSKREMRNFRKGTRSK